MSNFTGITPPRVGESLETRILRTMREFDRAVPMDLLARMVEEREDVVRVEVDRLVGANKLVYWGMIVK